MTLDIITGSRAEYGIMKNLIGKMVKDSDINTRVVVTGMHLEEKFGYTINDIKNDGIEIFETINSDMTDSTDIGIITSIEKTMNGFKKYFNSNRPDAILVLGDRYEIFAVSIVASMFRIPIIHLHGGEKTNGNYDEFIRHSITKMSHMHFVSTSEFKKRVIQLGENKKSVFNVGALGVENILKSDFYSTEEINKEIDFITEKDKYFVLSYHSETLSSTSEFNTPVLEALESKIENYKVIMIGTNSDTGSEIIMHNMRNFEQKYPDRVKLLVSVPSKMYYSLIKNSKLFLGNSSSGLIEVPSLGKVSINIGNRQKGRVTGNSVINCKAEKDDILNAINNAEKFEEIFSNPYEGVDTCNEIIRLIKENDKLLLDVEKDFCDMEEK